MIIDRLPFSEYCLLYCPHGTTWLPLDGFSWNLRVFRKPAEKIQVSLKCDKNSGCFTRRSLSFMTTLSWILFKMRYVSGKSCIESKNTHLCPKPFFFICAFYEMHCLSISLLLRFWLWNCKHLSQLFILLWGGMYLWFLLWSVHALHSIVFASVREVVVLTHV